MTEAVDCYFCEEDVYVLRHAVKGWKMVVDADPVMDGDVQVDLDRGTWWEVPAGQATMFGPVPLYREHRCNP